MEYVKHVSQCVVVIAPVVTARVEKSNRVTEEFIVDVELRLDLLRGVGAKV